MKTIYKTIEVSLTICGLPFVIIGSITAFIIDAFTAGYNSYHKTFHDK